MSSSDMRAIALAARRRLLQMHYEAKIGHIGGNLSCLDALLVLKHRSMAPEDQLVLSKGHSAGALYIALWSAGQLDEGLLKTFHKDGTRLSGHPVAGWHPGIRFGTGSLGHGLSLAAGVALGQRLGAKPGRAFCVMSDGEWQEGSTWEALIFAVHQKLENLSVLIDCNGLQGFGSTAEVASMDDLRPRLAAFGAEVLDIDGHDHAAIEAALKAPAKSGKPRVLAMRTTKGKGVPFMEGRMEWHYKAMDQGQYESALEGLK